MTRAGLGRAGLLLLVAALIAAAFHLGLADYLTLDAL